MKGASLIFHIDDNGWILVYEFIDSFTDLTYSSLITVIEAMNLKEACQFRDVQRSEYPRAFLDLDRYVKSTRIIHRCSLSYYLLQKSINYTIIYLITQYTLQFFL